MGGEYLAKRNNESDEEYKARMRVNARRYLSTPEGKSEEKRIRTKTRSQGKTKRNIFSS